MHPTPPLGVRGRHLDQVVRDVSRRILLACFEPPGYGGAGTATYDLFERAQREGLPVSFLNLVDRHQESFFRATFGPGYGNPRALENAHTCVLQQPFQRTNPALAKLVRSLAPDVILTVGYIAALALRRAAPRRRLLLFTAGCDQIDRYLRVLGTATAVRDWLRAGNRPVLFHRLERRAVETADLLLAHSDLVRDLLTLFYPGVIGKLYPDVIWMAEWIHGAAQGYPASVLPFAQRDIDLLLVASRWNRPEKNLPLARAIIERCPDLSIHIAGELDGPVANATCHGLLASRTELFALFGRARVVASTSRWDAAPGVLFEASALGSNVVASRNCGNWRICSSELLVDSYDADCFVGKVRLAVARRYADNVTDFLESGSYRTLRDILELV